MKLFGVPLSLGPNLMQLPFDTLDVIVLGIQLGDSCCTFVTAQLFIWCCFCSKSTQEIFWRPPEKQGAGHDEEHMCQSHGLDRLPWCSGFYMPVLTGIIGNNSLVPDGGVFPAPNRCLWPSLTRHYYKLSYHIMCCGTSTTLGAVVSWWLSCPRSRGPGG